MKTFRITSARVATTALAAAALLAGAAQAQAQTPVSLIGQSVNLTNAGNAPLPLGGTPAGQFGTLTTHVVGSGVELSKASNPSAYALFGNGDFAFNLAANSMRIVYFSGSATEGSRVEDWAFSITLNDPNLQFAAVPVVQGDLFAAYNGAPNGAPGTGWVPTLLNPQTVTFNLLNMRLPRATDGAGFTATADVLFNVVSVPAIPEPGTYALMALGLAAVGVAARRRQAAH
jgi:hypothetical protein